MPTDYPRTREGSIERCAKKCVHFNGVQNKVCKAGISYDSIKQRINEFVCFGEAKGCDSFKETGIEAAKKRFEDADKSFDKIAVARPAILEELKRRFNASPTHDGVIPATQTHRWNKQTNYFCGAGVMDCPVCKTGKLQYSRATYNGHVHARCSTADCVAWME
jgi:hypothetical protein